MSAPVAAPAALVVLVVPVVPVALVAPVVLAAPADPVVLADLVAPVALVALAVLELVALLVPAALVVLVPVALAVLVVLADLELVAPVVLADLELVAPVVLAAQVVPAVPVDLALPAAARAARSATRGTMDAIPIVPIPARCMRPSTTRTASPSACRTAFCGLCRTRPWTMRTPTPPVTTTRPSRSPARSIASPDSDKQSSAPAVPSHGAAGVWEFEKIVSLWIQRDSADLWQSRTMRQARSASSFVPERGANTQAYLVPCEFSQRSDRVKLPQSAGKHRACA
jgi:hypothetical protein